MIRITKKVLIIILAEIVGAIAIVTIAVQIKNYQFNESSAKSRRTPSATGRSTPPPVNTGAIVEQVIIEAKNIQFGKLIGKLPVNTQNFAIFMDYSSNNTIVAVYKPYKENYALFKKWLTDNGFGQIPQEKFKINYQ
jgi:hypothetical protein